MMNSSSFQSESNPVQQGIVSNEDFITITYALAYVMLVVSFLGIVTNSINIRTFIAMGLEDGITVTLAGLAISDLGFTLCGFVLSSSNILNYLEVRHNLNFPIQPKFIFGMFSANIGLMFYQVTCMITTFLAIARCMCVAMPFKFRDFFTKSRSIFALIVFNCVAASSYIPLLSSMGTRRKFDPYVNRTRRVLWLSSKTSEIKDTVSIIHLAVFTIVSSIMVGICIIVMAKYLRQSVQFRQDMATKDTSGSEGKEKSGSKLSGKELQAVQQVIIICIIYSVTMVPNLSISLLRLMYADFDVNQRLHNLYFVISDLGINLILFNSASTFLVYYFYNSKFRSLCFSLGPKQG